MVARIAGIALLVVIAALAAAAATYIQPDLPADSLIRRYGSANSHFLRLPDGSHAHVEIEGDAQRPVVVLLHGAMSSLQSFAGWRGPLAQAYRVIAIDLPGNGLTGETVTHDYSRAGMVSFVHAVLGVLTVHEAALVGHSMGGGVAAEYTEKYPGEVWALILIDASGVPRAAGSETGAAKLARNPLTRRLVPWIMPRAAVARALRHMFGDPSKVTDQMVDRITELERFPGNRTGLLGHYMAPNDDAWVTGQLSTVKAATLIEWGAVDPVLPLSAAEVFHAQIPQSHLVVYPGVGHVPIEEIPAASVHDALDFLAATGVRDKGLSAQLLKNPTEVTSCVHCKPR
jgi:pimeloyl-ACP methyl ester carboxylesterase